MKFLNKHRVAWLCIISQAISINIPALAFISGAQAAPSPPGETDGNRFLSTPAMPLASLRTQVYTLSVGDTTASVAEKYNMTPEILRQLNRWRTFAHGFDHLQSGDELDVPVTPLPKVQWDDDKIQDAASADRTHGDEQARKVAGVIAGAGRFLANNPDGDSAAAMARGMAAGQAEGHLQQWLSQFGTARVQLAADEHFSLKNSQFDLLVPLYDRGENMVFTQGSLHRTDDRTQSNLGVGVRHFTPGYMLGGNLFADYDLSQNHARAGMGVEYWRDFLKLNANGYLRLTNWKDSPDLTDYEARPANGWDVRVQAWLPSLPQLGGKLAYEQYYGKEVALFGKDNRQHNPSAFTAGVNYTPVPLITLNAEQRLGSSGKNDNWFGVDINYRPGIPWQSQIDPAGVAAMRNLTGSRYDLVERNNNIVLEYRKKDVIRLQTAKRVTGYAGEQKSLGVSVSSKYGLAHMEWSASSLLASGGKMVQNGNQWNVELPAFQPTEAGKNTYTVSGVAVDTKGNRSNREEIQVTVQAQIVNTENSTFTPANSELPADGSSTQELILTIKDGQNQTVDIAPSEIAFSTETLKSAQVSSPVRTSAGVYAVTVTAGTENETVTVTPVVSGAKQSPATVVISRPGAGSWKSAFSSTPKFIAADNNETATLTFMAKDENGKSLSGIADKLSFMVTDSRGNVPPPGAVTLGTITENGATGVYTATLKGGQADTVTIVPQYDRQQVGNLSETVKLNLIPSQMHSQVSLDTPRYATGNHMTVTVTLKDETGTPVTGVAHLLTARSVTVANAEMKSRTPWIDNGNGTYTATYTAKTTGTGLKAILLLSDWSADVESASYDITRAATLKSIELHDGYEFKTDEGFPTTGFEWAKFTLALSDGSAADYTWTSDASWVSVSNGEVLFTGKGNRDRVTITGTPKRGGDAITYSFKLKRWFIGDNWGYDRYQAMAFCQRQPGYRMVSLAELSGTEHDWFSINRGTIGGLWSEWGELRSYDSGSFGVFAWATGKDSRTVSYLVDTERGDVYESGNYTPDGGEDSDVICSQGL